MKSIWRQVKTSPGSVRAGAVFWLVAAAIGSFQFVLPLVSLAASRPGPEFQRRELGWSRSYGFGLKCAVNLLPNASLRLVNPIVGPGEPSPGFLGSDPDATPFAYGVKPRFVSLDWDLSSPWVPPAGDADYIALWQQGDTRTPAQQSAASMVAQTLAGRPVVCAYTNAQGDRGTIYAASSRASAAALTNAAVPTVGVDDPIVDVLPSPYSSPGVTLLTYVGILGLWGIGALVAAALPRRGLPKPVAAALALPIGCIAVAMELTVLSFLRIAWQGPVVLLPWLALAVGLLLRHRGAWARPMRLPRLNLAPGEKLALGVLAVLAVLLVAAAPFGLPVLDGFTAGYFKAGVFWSTASLLPFFEHANSLPYTHPTHPPLVPLTIDWLYLFAGGIDEHATLVLWPALYCALFGMLYALLRTITSRSIALWSTVGIALAASDLTTGAQQYGFADLNLALFLLGGVGVLWVWCTGAIRSSTLPMLAGILLAGAAWTKEEGIVAGPVAVLTVAFFAWRMRRTGSPNPWWHAPLSLGAGWLVVVLPLFVLRVAYPAPQLILHAASVGELLQRLPIVIIGFAARAVKYWYLPLGMLLLAAWHLQRNHRLGRSLAAAQFWLPATLVIAQLGADVAGVTLNPLDVQGELSWAAGRLLMQLSPLVYLSALSLVALALRSGEPNWSATVDGLSRDRQRAAHVPEPVPH